MGTRRGRVVALARDGQTLAGAAAAFLAQPDLAASTRRSYQQTLGRLERALGGDRPLAALTVDQVTATMAAAWGGCRATVPLHMGRYMNVNTAAGLRLRPDVVARRGARAASRMRSGCRWQRSGRQRSAVQFCWTAGFASAG